jgi:TolB-like protein
VNGRATPASTPRVSGATPAESASAQMLARLQASIGDRYDVKRELGRGGMATVYLANDIKHDREVAIKVLLPELSASIGGERFEREIRLAAKLQHPHILGLFDSGVADGLLYYVMPFVKGESLRDRIDREGMLPIEDAIGIALEVAGALGHAHALGIVHRDIKPENILLNGEFSLVADFGIARAVSEAGAQKITQTGMAVGTPVYMAPEQSMGETAGPTADLYSLGCVLYEMLAGEPPFTGKNAAQIMARHAMEQVPSIRIVRQAVPEEIEDAIFAALAKVPADRPQNAADFAQMLGMTLGSTRSMRVMRGATATRRVPSGSIAAVQRRSTMNAQLYEDELFPEPVPAWKNPKILGAVLLVIVAALGAWKFGALGKKSAATASPDANRIAVLYFKDVSKDSSLGPLADGLTEGLIRTLGTSTSINVISQAGVEKFRTSTAPDDSIAKALRAGYLVRGEVDAKSGEKVGVDLQLIDASGAKLNKSHFEVAAKNLNAMRDTLAVLASDLIKQQLGSEIKLKESRYSTNADAWLLLQRGLQAQKGGEGKNAGGDVPGRDTSFAAADSLFGAAEKSDAQWSEPVTRRAVLAYRLARLNASNPELVRKWTAVGREHANRAIAIDPSDADALEVRGNLQYFPIVQEMETDPVRRMAQIEAARGDLEKATTLNSRQAGAWATLSHLYYQIPTLAPPDIALAAQNAYTADEFQTSANLVLSRLFLANYDMQQFDRAEQWCAVARGRFPKDVRAVRCQLYLLTNPSKTPDVARAWRLADSAVALAAPAAQAGERLTEDMIVAAVIARASKAQPAQPALADSARHVAKRSEGSAATDKTRDLAMRGAFVYALLAGDKSNQGKDLDESIRLVKEYLAASPGQAKGVRENWYFKNLAGDSRFKLVTGGAQ